MTRKQRRRAWGSITEAKRGKKYILRWQEKRLWGRKRKTKTVYDTWLEPTIAAQVAASTLAPNTRNLVTRSWTNYVGPAWGSMPVDQLRPVRLQE